MMRWGAQTETTSSTSVRASFLSAVADQLPALGAATPAHCVVPIPSFDLRLPADEIRDRARDLGDYLGRATADLPPEQLFARASPLDEQLAPHLSFAGVYRSYRPARDRSRREHLVDGLSAVVQGRRNRLADYYYERHDIRGEREVQVMYSTFVPTMAMHGTGYSHGGRVLVTYYDTPLATYLDDPRRCAATGTEPPLGLDGQLVRCLAGIEQVIGVPVDVEFVITRAEQIFVTQVRPVSQVHLASWALLTDETWHRVERTGPPSSILGQAGDREGILVDLRHRLPKPEDGETGNVLVVSHRAGHGTSTMDLLEYALCFGWHDLVLVVDHGARRRDDHLQYVVAEDPAVDWVAHTSGLPDRLPAGPARVTADGFQVDITG